MAYTFLFYFSFWAKPFLLKYHTLLKLLQMSMLPASGVARYVLINNKSELFSDFHQRQNPSVPEYFSPALPCPVLTEGMTACRCLPPSHPSSSSRAQWIGTGHRSCSCPVDHNIEGKFMLRY